MSPRASQTQAPPSITSHLSLVAAQRRQLCRVLPLAMGESSTVAHGRHGCQCQELDAKEADPFLQKKGGRPSLKDVTKPLDGLHDVLEPNACDL